jgi:hypothetical protein
MQNPRIKALLNRLRAEFLETESDRLFCQNQLIQVDDKPYRLNVWDDFHGASRVIVFEIKEPSIVSTESLSLGLKYSTPGSPAEALSQEQLNAMGIR